MILLLLACASEPPPLLVGQALDGREGTSAASGAAITTVQRSGAEVGRATADGQGRFEVELPVNSLFSVVIEAVDRRPTSFTGYAGTLDLELPVGAVWAQGAEEAAALDESWAGCPGLGEGASVYGEVRLYLPVDAEASELPLVKTAWVELEDSAGAAHSACFLGEEGLYDSAQEMTGESGLFALFGLPGGGAALDVYFDLDGTIYGPTRSSLWLPEGGAAPLYPAWVEGP